MEVEYVEDLISIKDRYEIPEALRTCHTATVGNYILEGHVPVEAIQRLLMEKPAIRGIALPGMPSGSPGMPDEKTEAFEIYAFTDEGSSVYMVY
ncbi:DUF411 domain-containing protein [Chloroflexota bacterium]